MFRKVLPRAGVSNLRCGLACPKQIEKIHWEALTYHLRVDLSFFGRGPGRRVLRTIASCAAGATAGNGKAMPRRPASCGAGTARQPAVHPRQRATSVAADGSATRHIMVQVLVDIV